MVVRCPEEYRKNQLLGHTPASPLTTLEATNARSARTAMCVHTQTQHCKTVQDWKASRGKSPVYESENLAPNPGFAA